MEYQKRVEHLASSQLDILADLLIDVRCALRDHPEDPSLLAYALECATQAEHTLLSARFGRQVADAALRERAS